MTTAKVARLGQGDVMSAIKQPTATVAGNTKWPDELISAESELVKVLLQASEALSEIRLKHLSEELELTHTDAVFVDLLNHEVDKLHSFCCVGEDKDTFSLESANESLPMSARVTQQKVEEFGLLMDEVAIALAEPYLFSAVSETKDAVVEIVFSLSLRRQGNLA
jgi:hypothetical protein